MLVQQTTAPASAARTAVARTALARTPAARDRAARSTPRHPTLRLLKLLAPYWRRLLPAAAAAACAELAAVALMATAAWLISRAAQQPPLAAVAVAIVAVRALAIGRGVLRYADRLLGHDAVLSAVAGLRTRVYEALAPLAPAGTPAFRSGDLLTRLVDDVDAAQDLLLRILVPATVAGAVAATATGLSVGLLPSAGAALAVGLLLAGALVPLMTFALSGRSGGEEKAARGALAARTLDLTQGAADLAAFGAAREALAQASGAGAGLARLERRKALSTGLATSAVLLLQGLTTVVVTLLALRAHAAGELPAVHLAVLAVLALTTFEALAPLPAAARRFAETRASARRLSALLDAEPPVAEPAEPASPGEPPVALRISGLRARHRADAPAALDGIDLTLKPGRRVAIVGASGSGKSTLLAVLMRFLDYESGSVTVGGVELRACHGDDVRRLITGVTQDAHVFHAAVRENLALAKPDATHEELRAAARRARLLDWIESLPNGWDTVLGESGASMSGGQRQRLLLARALLADPPVLLLDEPTEGLDPDSADEVLADLLDATRGRTTLLVTHRPAGLAAADEVIVLDGGRVVQRGTHSELLSRPGYIGAGLQ
ncbi:thiol reductant ABC exporter subunit CydC [Streptomyces sp. H27-D2]|uniref:thiol reductant ABC exporter subunit CydC n=1 Tax=Streptomyces sp. H27-D2 TaxID=3046304 RepID=UPI002DBF0AF3|nr:thiol reductant ABC exporter subunit CydC [Streptomyces sp. H27-D2]MEC4017542.1 thiol reductant ABC exporter subunit CydC [Streptomyces sp. H27-D2]